MKTPFFLLLFLLASCVLKKHSLIECQNNSVIRTYLIQSENLFDAKTGKILKDIDLYVVNGQINQIGKNISVPQGTQIILLKDSTLLPGLIDTHTLLLCRDSSFGYDFSEGLMNMIKMTDQERIQLGTRNATSYLKSGITTVRDLGNSGLFLDLKLKQLIDTGIVRGPRMFVSGPGIAVQKGQFYPSTPLSDVTKEYFIIDESSDIKSVINHYKNLGVHLLKLYADNDPAEGEMPFELMSRIITTANKVGLSVAVHASNQTSILNAINAGATSIQHGTSLNDAAAKEMRKRGTYLVPTDINQVGFNLLNKERAKRSTEELSKNWSYYVKIRQSRLKTALNNQVPIAFGSDTYFDDTDLKVGAGSMAKNSLLALKDFGLANSEVLQAATIHAARLLGQENELGILKIGAKADIIAVKGNPLDNLDALQDIILVIKDGNLEYISEESNFLCKK